MDINSTYMHELLEQERSTPTSHSEAELGLVQAQVSSQKSGSQREPHIDAELPANRVDDALLATAPKTVQEELAALGMRPLWGKENFSTPAYSPKKERFEHRMIAYIKATQPGLTNREIGARVGLHEVTVAYLMRQPYMELAIMEEIKKAFDPALQLLQNETFSAAQRLIEISRTAENEETKRKANNDILDRKYGKPNQPMSMVKKEANQYTDQELVDMINKAQGMAAMPQPN